MSYLRRIGYNGSFFNLNTKQLSDIVKFQSKDLSYIQLIKEFQMEKLSIEVFSVLSLWLYDVHREFLNMCLYGIFFQLRDLLRSFDSDLKDVKDVILLLDYIYALYNYTWDDLINKINSGVEGNPFREFKNNFIIIGELIVRNDLSINLEELLDIFNPSFESVLQIIEHIIYTDILTTWSMAISESSDDLNEMSGGYLDLDLLYEYYIKLHNYIDNTYPYKKRVIYLNRDNYMIQTIQPEGPFIDFLECGGNIWIKKDIYDTLDLHIKEKYEKLLFID